MKKLIILFLTLVATHQIAYAQCTTIANNTVTGANATISDNLEVAGVWDISTGVVVTVSSPSICFTGPTPVINLVGTAKIIFTNAAAVISASSAGVVTINGNEGTVEINSAGTVTLQSSGTISSSPCLANGLSNTLTGLHIYSILAPRAGSFVTNNLLTLKAADPVNFGRVQWCDYSASSANTRPVYSGSITGNVTMEKKPSTTNLPDNAGWRQWSFPLNATDADITGLDIKGAAHPTAKERNAYYWNASIYSTTTPLMLVGGPRALKAGADGWATGWTAAPTNMYRRGFTIFSTNNANVNSAYGYNIDPTVTVTGTVGTDNIRGGYNLAGTAEDLTAAGVYLPASQDTGIGAPPASNNDIGWVQLYNPWPSVLDTWFMLRSGFGGGAWGSSTAGQSFNTNYNGIHVWDATNQQYLGWTGTFPAGSIVYNTGGGVTVPNLTQAAFDILPFQSFWVKNQGSLLGDPQVSIDRRFTKPSIDGPAYLKTTTVTDLVALAVFDADSARDTWGVYYNSDFTDNFDLNGGDAYKIFSASNVPTLHSLEAEQNAQLVSRMPKAIDTVQLYFYSFKNNQTCHIFFNDDYAGNLTVVLHDKLTNVFHNLSQNTTYSFTHNTSNAANRFELIVSNSGISVEEEQLAQNPVTVFMAGEEMVIKSENYTGPAEISCFDMAGRLMFKRKVEMVAGNELRFIAPLAKSQINMIQIIANNQKFVERIVH